MLMEVTFSHHRDKRAPVSPGLIGEKTAANISQRVRPKGMLESIRAFWHVHPDGVRLEVGVLADSPSGLMSARHERGRDGGAAVTDTGAHISRHRPDRNDDARVVTEMGAQFAAPRIRMGSAETGPVTGMGAHICGRPLMSLAT